MLVVIAGYSCLSIVKGELKEDQLGLIDFGMSGNEGR